MIKKLIKYLIFLGIPIVLFLSGKVFPDKNYAFVSLLITIIACVPFFMEFEKSNHNTHKLVIIAVMVAMSVAGRFIFAMIPGFKPVTAIVVITAMYFGGGVGFMTGALSAVISNFYFGQGPWTPFQMLSWGFIGLFAGLFAGKLKNSRIMLAMYGVIAGILFSLVMDAWSVIWYQNGFDVPMYLTSIITAIPYTLIYAVSNVIFLILLDKPMGKKLTRIKQKYGL